MNGHLRNARAAVLAAVLALSAAAAEDSAIIVPGGGTPRGEAAMPAADGVGSVSLVAGLLLAVAGGWFLWRNRRRVPVARDGRALAIDETRSLGNRQYLVVASHEGKRFLLGVCPGQINFLSALSDSDREGPGK